MSWHYLQEGAAESWDPYSRDSPPDALSRLWPQPVKRFYADRWTASYLRFLFGIISKRLTVARGVEKLTLLPADSRALTSVRQVKVGESPERIRDSFSKCCESLRRYGLALSSRKTVRNCVPGDSVLFSTDLPAWGMMLNGECWELGTSVQTTAGNECGLLLPTPTGAGNEFSQSMQKWPGHRRLMDWLANLPTPKSSEERGIPTTNPKRNPGLHARLIAAMKDGIVPTPTAKLYGSNQGGAAGRTGKDRPSLESLIGGVFLGLREWMMGVPIGWTSKKPLPNWRWKEWQRSHGIETRESS